MPCAGLLQSVGYPFRSVKAKPGRALGDQIRSIDKSRLRARVATLTADEMARIDDALAITLDLRP
jgi:mRNA-degrading endonuclease toxin of MazEF toxin-antitoxin module